MAAIPCIRRPVKTCKNEPYILPDIIRRYIHEKFMVEKKISLVNTAEPQAARAFRFSQSIAILTVVFSRVSGHYSGYCPIEIHEFFL